MKMIIVFAFVLAAGLASATELKVPGKSKQPVAKSPPTQIVPAEDVKMKCLQEVAKECDAKNWTKLGKLACYRVKKRACR